MGLLKGVSAFIVLTVVGLVLAVALGIRSWNRNNTALVGRLAMRTAQPEPLDRAHLPDPVRRYLARAIPAASHPIISAQLEQSGHFQMGEGPEGWRSFEARETFRVSSPGFLWDATIEMAPAVWVRVRDVYLDGEAQMLGKILGLVPVVDLRDSAQLASGALARYLAEAVWFPTRLAVGPDLIWEAVDDHTAIARLEDKQTAVRLEFTFDDRGDPIQVRGIRAREHDGRFVPTPWLGRFAEHREMNGFRIPTYGEVAWILDGTEVWYWKGTITSADFDTGSPRAVPTAR